jgi:anti-sigma factor ChrR (cupin superfamily)
LTDFSDEWTAEDLSLLDRIAAEAIDPVTPPHEVRANVLAAIRNVPGPHQSHTVRANEGKWIVLAPGVRSKRLTKDARRTTLLVELEPHAVLPEHDHDGGEDSYVVRGSCSIGALSLEMGDFHHADAGAHHGDVVASAEGCVLLITLAAAA